MTERDFNRMDSWTLGASMDEDSEGVGALIETPSAILAKIKQVNNLVETLMADIKINDSKLRPVFVSAWEAFAKEWEDFYKEHSEGFGGWTSRLWGATAEQTESFLNRVKGWREGYEKEAGLKATGPSISEPSMPWKWIIGGTLVVGAIVAIGYAARGIRGVMDG